MGVPENKLNSQHWQNVEQRMQTEEAACVLTGAEAEENGYVFDKNKHNSTNENEIGCNIRFD